MDLGRIQQALERDGLLVSGVENAIPLTSVTDDSRRVERGTLFCAVDGATQDGHAFVEDAMSRGAVAAIVSRQVDSPIPQVVVYDGRRAAATAAREWFGNPASRMSLIGVTGTNGKTTTVAFIWHLLNQDGSAGRFGTLGAFDGQDRTLQGYPSLTTPGPIDFHAVLADLCGRGVSTVALEASSHGLDQDRLSCVLFDTAVYTNLTHEHLDYHSDLDSYAAAKMKLSSLLGESGTEVVYADDPTWLSLPDRVGIRRVLYGRDPRSDVKVVGERPLGNGTEVSFRFGDIEQTVVLPLLGEFNVTNALAASATAWAHGLDPAVIAERLASLPEVPGRMERLYSESFTILRDYAHTPDGFRRSIGAVRDFTPGRLFVLFGVGGDRDRTKRPEMGSIAAELADFVILTEDNPRTEDPESTLDDVEVGLADAPHLRIRDRDKGIRRGISMLKAGDCLLLLGKGHETYQIIGTEKLPFDEREIVASAVGDAR